MSSKTFPKCVKIRTNPRRFTCVLCDYKCSRRSDMKNHIISKRHTLKLVAIENIKSVKNEFSCQYCDKYYKTRSGLWKHEKKCETSCSTELFPDVSKKRVKSVTEEKETKKDDMLIECMKMMKTQCEINQKLIENGVLGGSHNTSNSHNNSNNTNNISINVFLNDHCKDAKSIQDFVDNIKFKLTDFFDGQLPIKDSVSNVVVKQLNDMPTTERPIHCMDNRRGNFMVKDKDEGWVQDKGDMLANNIKRVQQKALLQSYDTFDAEYVPPHPGRLQDKKDAIVNPIRNGLQKDTSKIIKDVASVTNIKDAMKSLQDKK
jgi:hypothetical protein